MHVCTNCRRHVRERECPFCHVTHEAPETPASAGSIARAGLRRGALVASVVALTACGPSAVPLYGIPVDAVEGTDATQADTSTADAGSDATADQGTDSSIVAMYGIPPQDAGDDMNIMPPYGIPPEDSGTE